MFKGVECSDEIGSCYKPGCQHLKAQGLRALKTPDLEVDVFMKTQKNIGYGSQ